MFAAWVCRGREFTINAHGGIPIFEKGIHPAMISVGTFLPVVPVFFLRP
jgi:hypothetical protein